MKSKTLVALERERERESHNLEKIEEREGLYSKSDIYSLNRPLFICTAKVRKGKSVKDTIGVSGITLIALVITIVVLLILASISITAVFGDNGLIEMAREAADKTNEAVKKDLDDIQNIKNELENMIGGGTSSEDGGIHKLKVGDYISIPYKSSSLNCVVLYDDEYNTEHKTNYGIQIMALDDVGKEITFGCDSGDFEYGSEEQQNEEDKRVDDFNNAIKTLNGEANKVLSELDSSLLKSARSLGTVPGEPNTEGEMFNGNGVELREEDSNYEADYSQGNENLLFELLLPEGKERRKIWLGSRRVGISETTILNYYTLRNKSIAIGRA